ncbi:hypothetical protein CFOL_v3_12120 [Cephalotus follicularis]|uniref:Uncharacterized protein n=1 Tax=Cephalotus follicularis TaxID=3775 RepID=A0A1Q3BKS7_CEPFO|nr:hypothetical protein CFOL_v3_12120 [Cephalotus follicularis]
MIQLIPSCPVLQDFVIGVCYWDMIRKISISSRSLKRLTVGNFYEKIGYLLLYDTVVDCPSLGYLNYDAYLAQGGSLTAKLDSLAEASIKLVVGRVYDSSLTEFFHGISNVRSLSLLRDAAEAIYLYCCPLPVLGNLTRL